MSQTVIDRAIRKKEAQTSTTETLRDTSRVVRQLHLASTFFSGSWTDKKRNRTLRLLILREDHRL